MTPRRLFRALALAEAVTWSLLIVGMLLKYAVRLTDVGVTIGGGAHGFVFLAFAATSVIVAVNQHWGWRLTAVALASAIVPFATIPVERWLERRGRLAGDWRRVATGDPRDRSVPSRMLRWSLAHAPLTVALLLAAVAAVFVALLVIGPPGGARA